MRGGQQCRYSAVLKRTSPQHYNKKEARLQCSPTGSTKVQVQIVQKEELPEHRQVGGGGGGH